MKHGSLFSGIGGFDLAAEWAGYENIFHCEWNPFGQRVLKHYWPNAISYDDITKTDFTIHRGEIDILTGGFPCQPYSNAGKRKGKEDERHLWPEMLRAIREIQPSYIVGENVSGLVNWNGGMVFDEVQDELEAEGYQVTPFLLPAASLNAPHKRERVWFIAYSESVRGGRLRNQSQKERPYNGNELFGIPHRLSINKRTTSDTDIRSRQEHKLCARRKMSENGIDGDGISSDTYQEYYKCKCGHKFEYELGKYGCPNCCGEFTAKLIADTCDPRLQRGKLNGSFNQKAQKRGEFPSRSASELHQISDWQNFPTQSPICDGDDGLSSRLDRITFPKWRNESIKGGGNAIVPQVAYQIFKAINQFNDQNYGH